MFTGGRSRPCKIIVEVLCENSSQPLTINAKVFILDVARVLKLPLTNIINNAKWKDFLNCTEEKQV